MKAFYTLILMFLACSAFAQSKLPTCKGDDYEQWNSCTGTIENDDGSAYKGDFANGQINGYGLLTLSTGEKVLGKFNNSVLSGRGLLVAKDGSRYAGEFDQNTFNGLGITLLANGERIEGIFRNGQFVKAKKVTDPQILALLTAAPNLASVVVLSGKTDGDNSSELIENERKAAKLEEERLRVAKERERLDAEELQRQQAQQREQEEKLKIVETQRLENERRAAKPLDKDECVILVASTKSETEARAIAKKYPGSKLYTSKSEDIAVGLEKISKHQSAARIKELFAAKKIPKGSNCADNSRITGLLNVDSQKPEKQAELNPEKREQKNDPTPEAIRNNTAGTRGVYPETYYTNLSSFEVGSCVGYLSVESKKLGWENMHKGHLKYVKRNLRYLERVGEITRKFPECNGKGVDHIIQCLDSKGFAAEEIALVLGANTGIAKKDVSFRNAMAMICNDF